MASFPPRKNVPRKDVHRLVQRYLREKGTDGQFLVGRVDCREQPDGRYTLVPKGRRNELRGGTD